MSRRRALLSGKKDINYLCFTSTGSSTISFSSFSGIDFEYSYDKKTWVPWGSGSISLSSGASVYLRGNNSYINTSSSSKKFNMTGNISISGDIMTILDKTGNLHNITSSYCFKGLFSSCRGLVNAADLILSATEISTYCYQEMFLNSTNLLTAPTILMTNTRMYCCKGMFQRCSSLITPPANLFPLSSSQGCYRDMFGDCVALTHSPIIWTAATSTECFHSMFYGCSSLNKINFRGTKFTSNYTTNWVYNVSSTGDFYKISNVSVPTSNTNGIPTGWTVINT